MLKMKNIRLRNDAGECILYSTKANHMAQKGESLMKSYMEFEVMRRDTFAFRYADGVPAAEKKRYWNRSPWEAFRLLLRSA